MSSVNNAWVQKDMPSVQQPERAPTTSGSSTCSFTFIGVYLDSGNNSTVVVLQAGGERSRDYSTNTDNDGGIFNDPANDADTAGTYCCIQLERGQTDLNNWTVRARTKRDGSGGGYTFIGGRGGGGGRRH